MKTSTWSVDFNANECQCKRMKLMKEEQFACMCVYLHLCLSPREKVKNSE